LDGDLGEVCLQSRDNRNRRILRIADPEDDFEFGIVLAAKGCIVLIGPKVRSAKRNQNGNRGKAKSPLLPFRKGR
jgi:hypothetical protein